jgi:hypothetical protein
MPLAATAIDPELDLAWRKTCKLLLGQDIGPLFDYADYLKAIIDPPSHKKSVLSGKDVAVAVHEYAPGSKFVSFDEIDPSKKYDPLSINEIKDLDSIVEAFQERFLYSGNINLGRSERTVSSTNNTDAFLTYETAQFFGVKHLAFCTVGRDSSYCFGLYGPGETEYSIRCSQTIKVKRCFELWMSQNCSDCYFVYNLEGCNDCLFSFNMRNRRRCVGNLELTFDKFQAIKKKLVDEIAEELKQKKTLPSLLGMIAQGKLVKPSPVPSSPSKEKLDKTPVVEAFATTTKLLFSKKLGPIDDYDAWLYAHAHKIRALKSAASGKKVLVNSYVVGTAPIPEDRVVSEQEALEIGKQQLTASEVESLSLKTAPDLISRLAFLNLEFQFGTNANLVDCSMSYSSTDCYRCSATVLSRLCGSGMWPTRSEHCFGFDSVRDSSFCINCYHSDRLVRCFEMDNCRDCSDSMFCHNAEAITSGMFCFNVKSRRYAIGNAEVGPDKFKSVKQKLMEEIADKLERDKKLDWSIYNIGSGKK